MALIHSSKVKINVIQTLTYRCLRICSSMILRTFCHALVIPLNGQKNIHVKRGDLGVKLV